VDGNKRNITGGNLNFIMEDSQQPNSDVIEEWFRDDTDGDLYKIEDWFEFPDDGRNFTANNDADLNRRTANLNGVVGLTKAPYRFMWRRRAVAAGESANNYTNLFALVDTVSPASAPTATTIQNLTNFNAIADAEQWMRIFAIQHTIGNWDSYGYERGKNAYTYKPKNGGFHQWTWDIDFTMGVGGHATTQTIFDISDGRVTAMWNTPEIRRALWRAFYDLVNGPFNNAYPGPHSG
jgi:hypothetical protein